MDNLKEKNVEITDTESRFSRLKDFLRRQWKFVVAATLILSAGVAYTVYTLSQNESGKGSVEASKPKRIETEKARKRKRMEDYLKHYN